MHFLEVIDQMACFGSPGFQYISRSGKVVFNPFYEAFERDMKGVYLKHIAGGLDSELEMLLAALTSGGTYSDSNWHLSSSTLEPIHTAGPGG